MIAQPCPTANLLFLVVLFVKKTLLVKDFLVGQNFFVGQR
jgi:hypothetical protein